MAASWKPNRDMDTPWSRPSGTGGPVTTDPPVRDLAPDPALAASRQEKTPAGRQRRWPLALTTGGPGKVNLEPEASGATTRGHRANGREVTTMVRTSTVSAAGLWFAAGIVGAGPLAVLP